MVKDARFGGAALIGDVIGSRTMISTDWLRILAAALARVNAELPAAQPLIPTLGDEFQAVYDDVATALRASLLLRLELADAMECRFGIGYGFSATIGTGAFDRIQEGSAWWSARAAIVEVKQRESGRHPYLRTWYRVLDEDDMNPTTPRQDETNAYLLARDRLVTQMDARSRRLLLGTIQKVKQSDLAKREGIGQSAVSQNLRANGAYAVLEGAELFDRARGEGR